LVAKRKRAALGGVHKRNKDDVAFVSLELSGVSAKHEMEFVAIGRDPRTNQVVNFNGLFVANERDDAETHRLARVIVCVFGLLHGGGDERSNGERFLAVDFPVAARAGNTVRDGMRTQMNAACVAQRLNAAVVRNHIAELNDFRNAAEMLDETRCATERLARQIVNGNLSVVEIGVGDAAQVLVDEILNCAEILADSGRAYLLMVADDENCLAQIECDQSHHVALTGFVNDDNVEAS